LNTKIHYRVQKVPPLVPILSQMHPVHTLPPYFPSILIVSSHPRLGFLSGLFLSGFQTKTFYEFLLAYIHATCPAHLIFLDLRIDELICKQLLSDSSDYGLENWDSMVRLPTVVGNVFFTTTFRSTPGVNASEGEARYSLSSSIEDQSVMKFSPNDALFSCRGSRTFCLSHFIKDVRLGYPKNLSS
jgi:hypothetical protein